MNKYIDENKKRNIKITVRLNKKEHQFIEQNKPNMPTAKFIRTLALGIDPMPTADPVLINQIGRVGSNLNQALKLLYTLYETRDNYELLDNLSNEVKQANKALSEILEMQKEQNYVS